MKTLISILMLAMFCSMTGCGIFKSSCERFEDKWAVASNCEKVKLLEEALIDERKCDRNIVCEVSPILEIAGITGHKPSMLSSPVGYGFLEGCDSVKGDIRVWKKILHCEEEADH